jgi:hypothetical protein
MCARPNNGTKWWGIIAELIRGQVCLLGIPEYLSFFHVHFLQWRLLWVAFSVKAHVEINLVAFNQGLRTPNEAFFHWNPKLLGLGRQNGQINSEAFGVFSAELSTPILVQWVHVFHNSIIISTKELSLYIHIPNTYLGLGFEFEFGPQRIRDLAFVCP